MVEKHQIVKKKAYGFPYFYLINQKRVSLKGVSLIIDFFFLLLHQIEKEE